MDDLGNILEYRRRQKQRMIGAQQSFSGPRAASPEGQDRHAVVVANIDNLLNGKRREAVVRVQEAVAMDRMNRDRAKFDAGLNQQNAVAGARLEHQKAVAGAKLGEKQATLAETRRQAGSKFDSEQAENAAVTTYEREKDKLGVVHRYGEESADAQAKRDAASEMRTFKYRLQEMEEQDEIQKAANESTQEYELRARRLDAKLRRQEQGAALVAAGGQPAEGVDKWAETGTTSGLTPQRRTAPRDANAILAEAIRLGANGVDLFTENELPTADAQMLLARYTELKQTYPDKPEETIIQEAMDGLIEDKFEAVNLQYTRGRKEKSGLEPGEIIRKAMEFPSAQGMTFGQVVEFLVKHKVIEPIDDD
jgi:hypothetical protein